MTFSVIIPSRPDDPHLKRCIEAICLAIPSGSEIIVVADGWKPVGISTSQRDLELTVVSVEKAGPAFCRDFGARRSRHEWLCFVDSDVLVHRDSFVKSTNILALSGDDGLVGSYDDRPEDPGLVSRFRNLLHHFHHHAHPGMKGVFWGAFSIVRKSAYLDAGGFDPAFSSASVEDIDLGYRLLNKGYEVALRPEVQVTHLKRWTLPDMVRTDVFLRARPWTLLLHRYRLWDKGRLNTTPGEKISALLACCNILFLALILGRLQPVHTFVITSILFVLFQRRFYAFFRRRVHAWELPAVYFLHHIYYLSAALGWLLAQKEIHFNQHMQ